MQTIKLLTSTQQSMWFSRVCICLICSLISICAVAQVKFDTTGLKMINIQGDSLRGFTSEKEAYQRVIGNVIITHEETTMTCDSAHFFLDKNMVRAFSNVHINKAGGTQAQCDSLRYTGDNFTAVMQGNVQILDGQNTLYTERLTYNLKTKIGKYDQQGTLQTAETTVSSSEGVYNGFTKQAYFIDDVIITNPKYTIESDELTYHTQTKVIKFLAKSTIIAEDKTVYTLGGTYDSKNEKAVFTKRTTVVSEDQTIAGNKLTYDDKTGYGTANGEVQITDSKNQTMLWSDKADFNKITGEGTAIGHVIIEQENGKSTLTAGKAFFNRHSGYGKAIEQVVLVDTAEKTELHSDVIEFNDHSKFMMATGYPKLITVSENDSTFMRADTMLSMRIRDLASLQYILKKSGAKKQESTIKTYNLLWADSSYRSDIPDELKLIVANRSVRIFSDSMQVVCDSLSYSQADSTFRLFRSPVMWSKTSQSKGDTIYLKTKNQKLDEVSLRNNGLILSETGYDMMYDQVAGNFIDAFFVNSEIDHVLVDQNAESLYYAKDDAGAFIGLNKAESAKMKVFFKNKQVDYIVMLQDPKGKMYPIDQLTDAQKFLSSFQLLNERKPTSKEDIMSD